MKFIRDVVRTSALRFRGGFSFCDVADPEGLVRPDKTAKLRSHDAEGLRVVSREVGLREGGVYFICHVTHNKEHAHTGARTAWKWFRCSQARGVCAPAFRISPLTINKTPPPLRCQSADSRNAGADYAAEYLPA